MILVSVYDVKAETYTPPHVSQSKAAAIRDFEVIVNDKDKKTMISQHPEDFALFQVGEWFERVPVDDEKTTAKLVALPQFVNLALGIDLVKGNKVSN